MLLKSVSLAFITFWKSLETLEELSTCIVMLVPGSILNLGNSVLITRDTTTYEVIRREWVNKKHISTHYQTNTIRRMSRLTNNISAVIALYRSLLTRTIDNKSQSIHVAASCRRQISTTNSPQSYVHDPHTTISNEKICLQYFLVILKHMLQNY